MGTCESNPTESKVPVVEASSEEDDTVLMSAEGHDGYQTSQARWTASLKAETEVNNTFAGTIVSRRRVIKAQQMIVDESQADVCRQQLALKAPRPLPTQLEIDAEFPLSALPASMCEVIRQVADHLQVPVEAVGAALLGALFIVARGNYKLVVDPGYAEALTGYILVGMSSGSRKSAIADCFRQVIEDVEKERQIKFDAEHASARLRNILLTKIRKRTQAQLIKEYTAKDNFSFDEVAKLIAEKLEPIDKGLRVLESRPRLLVDSPTMKELALAMKSQGEAIGLFEAEGGIWKHRLRSSEDNILLKGFTMEPFADETSTGKSAVMRAPCLAILTLVQMDVAEKLFGNDVLKDHGVLPRILPVFASWKGGAKVINPAPLSAEIRGRYEQKIRNLLDITPPEGALHERTWYEIKMHADAREVLRTFQQEVNQRLHDGAFENFEAFGEKLGGHAVRLAGAIHLWQHDAPQEHLISRESMETGIALARFFANHAMAAFDMERLQAIKFAKKILKWHARERKPEFSKRDAQRGAHRALATQIQAGVDLLERHGFLRQYIKASGGVKCVMNPSYQPGQFKL